MRKSVLFSRLCLLLFIGTIILTCAVSWYMSGHYLQGDISSDMVYAHLLYEDGTLISDGWNGGNELHILRADWVFFLFFHIFEDWQMVRFVSTLVLHALIVLSFGYLLKQTGASRESFFIGTSILLVPYHFSYGALVLHGLSYTTFLIIEFFMLGLVLSLGRHPGTLLSTVVRTAILCALGFGVSLGGPRALLNIGCPLFFSSAILLRSTPLRQNRRFIASALCLFFSLLAYVIYSTQLSAIQSSTEYSLRVDFNIFSRIESFILNLLKNFGFQNKSSLVSLTGMLCFSSGLLFCCYVAFCIKALRQDVLTANPPEEDEYHENERLLRLMALISLSFMLLYKILISDSHNDDTYYILITVWFIPCLMIAFSRETIFYKRGIILFLCALMYLSSAYNFASFIRPEDYPQTDSIMFHHMKTATDVEGSVNFLTEEGYTFGYAQFWTASVVTEKSDGILKVQPLDVRPNKETPFKRHLMLSIKELYDHKDERPFILLTMAEEQALLNSHPNVMASMNRIYADGLYVVYEPAHPDDLFSFIML